MNLGDWLWRVQGSSGMALTALVHAANNGGRCGQVGVLVTWLDAIGGEHDGNGNQSILL